MSQRPGRLDPLPYVMVHFEPHVTEITTYSGRCERKHGHVSSAGSPASPHTFEVYIRLMVMLPTSLRNNACRTGPLHEAR